jgi:hypothetical protein
METGEMSEDTQTNNQTTQTGASETPASFEAWLDAQPDEVKTLYQAHTTGLHNTVKATREERDALSRQIKDLLPKAEKGSELEKSLSEISTRLEQAERRAAFAEEAVKPEIGCRNPKAAFLLAQADNLFDRKGNPDWAAIKAAAPELFGQPTANGNAGAGTQNGAQTRPDMNSFIRSAAGRR